MNEQLAVKLRLDAEDHASNVIEHINRQLREMQRLTGGSLGGAGAGTGARTAAQARASENQASRERISNTRREQSAERNRSQEKLANVRQETALENNASKQAIQQSRERTQAQNRQARERIDDIRAQHRATQLAGQAESRQIQRLRLQEQGRAREQRARLAQLRSSQRSIGANFVSWGTALTAVGTILGGSLINGIQNFSRRVLDVTVNIERLRLGLAALEGDPGIANRQIVRARELARLPGIQFEGGVRSITQLRASGFTPDTSARLLQEVSNLSAIAGRSADDTARALYQFTQIGGLRQFRTEELRQLYEIAPQLRRVFQELYGSFSGEGIQAAIEAGGRTFSEELDRILTRLERGPRAPEETLANQLENLQDTIDDFGRVLGRELEPLIRAFIRGTDDLISGVTRTLEQNPGSLGRVLAAAGAGGLAGGFYGERIARSLGGGSRFTALELSDIVDDILAQNETRRTVDRDTLRERGRLPSGGRRGVEVNNFRDRFNLFRQTYSAPDQQRTFLIDGEEVTGRRYPSRALTPFDAYQAARARTGGFRSFVLNPRSIGAGAGTLGVGALAALWEGFFDFRRGPDRPGGAGLSPLRQEIIASQEAATQQVQTFTNTLSTVDESFKSLARQINLFAQRAQVTRSVFESSVQNYADSLDDARTSTRTAVRPLIEEQREVQSRIDAIRANPEGRTFTDSSGRIRRVSTRSAVGEPALTRAQEAQVRALEEQSANLQTAIDQINSELEERERRALQFVNNLRQQNELLRPDYYIPPDEALRLYRQPLFGAGVGTPDPNVFDASRRRGIIRPTREAIPSGQFDLLNPISDTQAIINNLVEVSRNLLASRVGPEIAAPPRGFLGTATGTDVLRSGLLDPSRLNDLRSETRGLLNEWIQIQDTVSDFFRQADRQTEAGGFIPTVRTQAADTRDELQRLLDSLMNVQSGFEGLSGVPSDISAGLTASITQVSNAIRILNSEIEISLEASRDLREESIRQRVELSNQDFAQRFPELTEFPSRRQALQHPFFQQQRRNRELEQQNVLQRQIGRERLIEEFLGGSAESLFDEFIGPSILDAVGIGSGQSRAQERSLANLQRSVEESRQAIREDATLNARQQAEELLEITREYEREKREIERTYEEQRSDAFADWVRQQLLAIPKLILQQLNLQLAARATNSILSALGLGGNIPVSGGGLGSLFGGGGAGGTAGGTAGGAGFAASAATVGAVVSGALAAHNIGTGIRDGLFDDIGRDFTSPVTSFFEGLHFNNPLNDRLANMAGRNESQRMAYNLGRDSAGDIVDNFSDGVRQGNQINGSTAGGGVTIQGNVTIVPDNTIFDFQPNVNIGERQVKDIKYTMDELKSQGRL